MPWIRRSLIYCQMPSLCKYLGKQSFPSEYLGGVAGERERGEEVTGAQDIEKQPSSGTVV